MTYRRFIYATRGLYLLLALVLVVFLKHRAGSSLPLPLAVALLALALAAQVFRTWAAGFVGTTARERVTQAQELLTTGPYAHLRNPMYLGILVIVTCLSFLSGLWYAVAIAWATYAFVYGTVIPYEEAYLREKFGDAYVAYARAVPRLFPTWHGYSDRHGVFSLREALANEVASWIVLPVLGFLFLAL